MNRPLLSRRKILAGTCLLLGGPPVHRARAADAGLPLRIAISETMVGGANLNDARAAMQTWIKRMQADLHVTIEIDPKVFSTTGEVTHGIRAGELDAAALNVIEYRPIAELFDPHELLVGGGNSGPDQYILLVRRDGPFKRLRDLQGRRLNVLQTPPMCVAPAWLATLLEGERLGPAGAFFSSMVSDTKVSRVVLPVFFEQTDACLASKRGFDTMCELNPQVAKSSLVLAMSPVLVTCFYAFRMNYPSAARDRFLAIRDKLLGTPAGRQLATLFQFDTMNVADAGCLAGSLGILEEAGKIRTRPARGGK